LDAKSHERLKVKWLFNHLYRENVSIDLEKKKIIQCFQNMKNHKTIMM